MTDTIKDGQPLKGARLLLLVQNLPVPFDRRVWQEALALHAAGGDVTVVSPADDRYPPIATIIDGVEVHRYPAPPEAIGAAGYPREYIGALAAMSSVVRSLLRQRPPFDVIHFCNPPDLLFLVALRHRGTGNHRSRLVFDQHDLGPELVRAKHFPFSHLFEWLAGAFESLTYRSADFVIATNESYRRIAIGRGRKAPDSVAVVRSGPSGDWIQETDRTRVWHRGNRWLIGYVGVMGRQEGIDYLLNALSTLVHDRGLDVRLALAGSGPDVERLRQSAKAMGVSDNVDFLGRISDAELRSLLANSDVCVNSDEVNELNDLSTMNKILEYMALARPIVQFDVTEGRFSAGDASRYARPNDAVSFADEVQWVLQHPDAAHRMGQTGKRRFVEELSWERQAETLVGAYTKLLGRM